MYNVKCKYCGHFSLYISSYTCHFRCKTLAAQKTDDTQDKTAAAEDIPLVSGPTLVPVPAAVINSPLRDKTLISLNDTHYDLDRTLASLSFDLPISSDTVSTAPVSTNDTVSTNLLPSLTAAAASETDTDLTRYETSPKPSEAIDDEFDDEGDYVTLDCSNYALPSAIVTSGP